MPLLSQLARILETSPDRVQQLLQLGYLKGTSADIALPPLSALRWLKLMLRPLPSRPLFTIPEILEMSGLALPTFREIVLSWDIPLHLDPSFGELMSPDSLIRFINALHSLREPVRFDRIILLNWLQQMGSNPHLRPKFSYSKLLEMEIRRIAQLEEPERTIASQAFYSAYKDARTINETLNLAEGRRMLLRQASVLRGIERRMRGAKIAIRGELAKLPPLPLPSPPSPQRDQSLPPEPDPSLLPPTSPAEGDE